MPCINIYQQSYCSVMLYTYANEAGEKPPMDSLKSWIKNFIINFWTIPLMYKLFTVLMHTPVCTQCVWCFSLIISVVYSVCDTYISLSKETKMCYIQYIMMVNKDRNIMKIYILEFILPLQLMQSFCLSAWCHKGSPHHFYHCCCKNNFIDPITQHPFFFAQEGSTYWTNL